MESEKCVNTEAICKKLEDIMKRHNNVDDLWKQVLKAENKTRIDLIEAEKEFIKEIEEIWSEVTKVMEENKKTIDKINLDKSAQKESYKNIINHIMGKKKGEKFRHSFPYWSIRLAEYLKNSAHYKRLTAEVCDMNENQLQELYKQTDKLLELKNASVLSKFSMKYYHKKFKSIKNLFNGKVSKTKLSEDFDSFFKRRNTTWRRWWELVVDEHQSLDGEIPRKVLRNIIALPAEKIKTKARALVHLINGDTDMEFSRSKPVKKIIINNPQPNYGLLPTCLPPYKPHHVNLNDDYKFGYGSLPGPVVVNEEEGGYDNLKLDEKDMNCTLINEKNYKRDRSVMEEIFYSLDNSLKGQLSKLLKRGAPENKPGPG